MRLVFDMSICFASNSAAGSLAVERIPAWLASAVYHPLAVARSALLAFWRCCG
ncbi:hypothetical protein [Pyrobaculum ferrireducens]|uniref:hypothetical protein n=1 Tax=Pyrobaculum ferrireducens TaxID=1104324 RepID=UPI000A50E707|nr:hypothetical protein [Pyrobaculum ferrireducens]